MRPFRIDFRSRLIQTGRVPFLLANYLSGAEAFAAVQKAFDQFRLATADDHDALVTAFGLTVRQITFLEPYTLLFEGLDQLGHEALAICHFSQLVAVFIRQRRSGPHRIVTGFKRQGG